jgi:hypothetical protein
MARWGLAPSDPNEPVGVASSNPRAEALEETVFELMDREVPDERIIEELRRQAPQPRDLVAAARRLNMENRVRELSWYNAAWRLLMAASGASIESPSPEEVAKFEVLDELDQEPVSIAFSKLVEREPSLGQLAERLSGNPKPTVASFGELDRLVDPIVGPNAASTDPILRSHVVSRICRDHLADISGLLDDEPLDEGGEESDNS